jgi:hypothetical protein
MPQMGYDTKTDWLTVGRNVTLTLSWPKHLPEDTNLHKHRCKSLKSSTG